MAGRIRGDGKMAFSPEILMDTNPTAEQFRSGMVAIAGPPNAGKSTLLNLLLGQKISIVTPKPQTTRNRIVGIVNGENYQIVFLDTPGLHRSEDPLNVEMVRVATSSFADVDAVLFVIDATQAPGGRQSRDAEEEMVGYLRQITGPVILVLNKIDLIDRKNTSPGDRHLYQALSLSRGDPAFRTQRRWVARSYRGNSQTAPFGPAILSGGVSHRCFGTIFMCRNYPRKGVFAYRAGDTLCDGGTD
jgi:small GTP-binding protein